MLQDQMYGDAADAPPPPARALVVEDNSALCTHMARLLAGEGYYVLQADNGADALDVLRNGDTTVDLIVTDVWMPAMSGDHFARRVWRERPDMPIVFVSGHEPEESVQALLDAGNSAFLGKPFSRDALQLAINCVRAATAESRASATRPTRCTRNLNGS